MFGRRNNPAMTAWKYYEGTWDDQGYPLCGLDGCVAIAAHRTPRYEAMVREWELVVLKARERILRHEPQCDIVSNFDFGEPIYLLPKDSIDIRDPETRRRVAVAIARAELTSLSNASRVPTLSWMMRSEDFAASCVTLEQYNTLYDFRTLNPGSVVPESGDGEATKKWLGMVSNWDSIALNCGMPIPALVLEVSEKHKIDPMEAVERLSVGVLLNDGDDGRYKPRTRILYRDEVRDRTVYAMLEKMGVTSVGLASGVPRAAYAWREYRIARTPEMNETS